MVKHYLKKYLKYYKVRDRLSSSQAEDQRKLVSKYQELQKSDLPPISETGLKVFSQFEEDGKLLYLFSLMPNPNRTFVEFGSDDGINSNSANLYYHHDFTGLFLDGNDQALERGRRFFKRHSNENPRPVEFKSCFIKAENINDLIKDDGAGVQIIKLNRQCFGSKIVLSGCVL